MEDVRWFLPMATIGIFASTVAQCVTLVGVDYGVAAEGNPFAVLLGLGAHRVPLATAFVGLAYLPIWLIREEALRTRFDILVFEGVVLAMTVFFLLDIVNDIVVVF